MSDRVYDSKGDALRPEEWLDEVAETWSPSQEAIDALSSDATAVELAEGWEAREAQRRRRALDALATTAPKPSELVKDIRRSIGWTESQFAAVLNVDASLVSRVESGRGGGVLLNLNAHKLGQLCDQASVSREALALAVSAAHASASGYGFGYRPRMEADASRVAAHNREELVSWIRQLLSER
jgi:transcriptional regulator with XRE-family HTH domain